MQIIIGFIRPLTANQVLINISFGFDRLRKHYTAFLRPKTLTNMCNARCSLYRGISHRLLLLPRELVLCKYMCVCKRGLIRRSSICIIDLFVRERLIDSAEVTIIWRRQDSGCSAIVGLII